MDSQRLNNWIQSGTGIAIAVGLVLVIVELQQGRDAIRSQLTSDGFAQIDQLRTSMIGEQAAAVVAKSCFAPDELTPTDLIILDNYYSSIIGHNFRMKRLDDRGGFYSENDWKSNGSGWGLIFETPVGRAYWDTFPIDPEIKAAGDSHFARRQQENRQDCRSLFSAWQNRITEVIEDAGYESQPVNLPPDE